MIFARRGINIDYYPSVKHHLAKFRKELEPKPSDWKPQVPGQKWQGRKEGTYAWYEIQDAIDYWEEFRKPKIVYQEIQFHPAYAFDRGGIFSNNKTFILAQDELSVLAILNSPLMWWFNWRFLPHMKDEALSPMGFKMEHLPVASFAGKALEKVRDYTTTLIAKTEAQQAIVAEASDWLRHSFGIEKLKTASSTLTDLNADAFVIAARDSLPKKRKLTASEIQELRKEHAVILEPARLTQAEIFKLERELSKLVNNAYGLTPEETKLMWRTAPPRMPFAPTGLPSQQEPPNIIQEQN